MKIRATFEILEPGTSIKDVAHYYAVSHNFGKMYGRAILACPEAENWWYFAVSVKDNVTEIICSRELATLVKAITPEVKSDAKVQD